VNYLNEIAKHHKEWVSIAYSLGGNSFAEDAIQETYIKIHRLKLGARICEGGEVSKGYMWLTIRSVLFDMMKQEKKIEVIRIGEGFEVIDEILLNDKEDTLQKMEEAIDKLDWYSKKMLKIYMSGNTMRKISKDTGIGLRSVFGTIKYAKEQIRRKL
jgi:DNA-directed RNA polymerase specialized sigma24 family protein